MNKLMPCPFCGGKAEINTWRKALTGVDGFSVTCENQCIATHDDEAEAVSKWNARAVTDEMVDAAEKAIDDFSYDLLPADIIHREIAKAVLAAVFPPAPLPSAPEGEEQ